MTLDDLRGPAGLAVIRDESLALSGRIPRGIDRDDLDSAGAEGLVAGLGTYNPAAGASPETHCRNKVRYAMLDCIRRETGKAGRFNGRAVMARRVSLAGFDRGEDTEGVIVADGRQAGPADIAAAREQFSAPRPRRDLAPDLPTPGEVANRVTELRAAMFGAIDPAAVADVMTAMLDKAKGGNLAATKMLIDLLAPGKSGVTVTQQAVVIQQGDIG